MKLSVPASFRTSKKKKMLIASIALLSIGLGGTAATGAYFTDSKTVTQNQLTAGTVVLGNIADDATSTTPVTFNNVLPVADADVATKAQTFNVNIRNNGTAAIDWKSQFIVPTSSSSSTNAFAKQVNLQYSNDGGSTWSAVKTVADFNNSTFQNNAVAPLAAGGATQISFRAWLPASTDNSAQGQSLTFTLAVSAIQAGAPFPS